MTNRDGKLTIGIYDDAANKAASDLLDRLLQHKYQYKGGKE